MTRVFYLAIFAILFPLLANAESPAPTDENGLLHVMLQGDSAESMASLATTAGGTISHFLPVINAVGARLTPDQFERLRDNPAVTRYIDDLALSVEPQPEDDSCPISAAMEIDAGAGQFSWKLYNKSDKPWAFSALEFDWPTRLGALESLTLGNEELASNIAPPHAFSAEEVFLPANGPTTVVAKFANVTGSMLQSEITFELSLGDDCEVSLVPGYPNNHGDHYFATVTGAADLHRHEVTGRGVSVAVLDSGLWEHPALLNDSQGNPRVKARYDAIAGETVEEAFDESGHGTHMTSVLAHSEATTYSGEATGSYKGIAPDVDVIVVKAFDVEGQGDFLDIVRGIQWVVDNRQKYNIRVLNLSFAARPRWPYWLDPINQAVMRAWAAGIVVVAAAGNEGPEPMTIGSPGNLPYIITVGAVTDSWTVDDTNDDYVPAFSSQGPTPSAHIKPDLVAPGGHITGITRPGSTLSQTFPEYFLETGEFVMTGTSQASALVSGLVALLLQLDPSLTPDEVKCKLTSSANLAINRDGKLAYSPFQQGHGYVSLKRAITLGERDCGNPGMDIAKDIAGIDRYQGPAITRDDGTITLPGLETIFDGQLPEGPSDQLRWGVKAHIERSDALPSTALDPNLPFDWEGIYQHEKEKIEQLATPPLRTSSQ